MRILHTSDWHVGKALRGRSRLAEHRSVLAELVELAEAARPDLVLVVGDLFEGVAPAPDAQRLVNETLLALRDTGARVVVVAGNHDSPAAFEAVRPLFGALGVVVAGRVRPADEGGVVEVEAASGELARVALLPFLSQRYVVRAADLMAGDASDHAGAYAARLGAVVGALTSGFGADTVNVLAAHCFVRGGVLGGGERDAHTVHDYACDPSAFPGAAHYVALGHLHRAQSIRGSAGPAWYSGSPIQVDFGEEGDTKQVLQVDVSPSTPARVTPLALTRAWRLQTLRGSLAEIEALAPTLAGPPDGEHFLRVVVRGSDHAGLADDVRAMLPNAVEVRVERDEPPRTGVAADLPGRTAHELFADYLAGRDVADPEVEALFAELYDEVSEAG